MFLCLRVDLDYVPWDADEFGHGEPAMVLRLLDLARSTGLKLHFFASNRSLRAFPGLPDAVLGEGHHLDWLLPEPWDRGALEDAGRLFKGFGITIHGVAARSPVPETLEMKDVQFVSALEADSPKVRLFTLAMPTDRDAITAGSTIRSWIEEATRRLRAGGNTNGQTLGLTAAVLAKVDPKLQSIREIAEQARALGIPIRTLRDVMKDEV